MTPQARSSTYAIGLIIGILGILAAVIFGLLNLTDAKELGLWIVAIFSTTAAGVATKHRPTKPPDDMTY